MSFSNCYNGDLQWLTQCLMNLNHSDAVAELSTLVREPVFWQAQIQPLLEDDHHGTDLYIGRSFGTQNNGAVLQLFVWPPGTATQIHDHSCWGVLHCIVGSVWEERYERLDDGKELDVAHLRPVWSRSWSRPDGVTTFLPYEGGIHRIVNESNQLAISAHIYGPRTARIDGRDYNPTCDYVCDRFEE